MGRRSTVLIPDLTIDHVRSGGAPHRSELGPRKLTQTTWVGAAAKIDSYPRSIWIAPTHEFRYGYMCTGAKGKGPPAARAAGHRLSAFLVCGAFLRFICSSLCLPCFTSLPDTIRRSRPLTFRVTSYHALSGLPNNLLFPTPLLQSRPLQLPAHDSQAVHA